MIRPGRSTRYNATAGSTGSDTDALQTDVMRFMSILGLCLMAVFALAQSIPLQETDAIPPEPEREKLHAAIAIQQERARVLQADLDRLVVEIQSAQAQKALDDIRQRASTLKTKRAPTPGPPVIEKRPPPVSAPAEKGFTLRFASDEALESQLAAGTASLYAMAGKQAWRLSLRHGRPVFAHDTFPGWFHEMASSTVPVRYVRTLGKSMDRPAQSSIIWGVQLPPATKRGIASLTRGRQGGNLVIAADGQVTLTAE